MSYKILIFIGVFMIISCGKEKEVGAEFNPEVIKSYRNERIKSERIDSADAVNLMLTQKLQEVYDLGTLKINNDKDSLLEDNLLTEQLRSYFYGKDSLVTSVLLEEIDTLNVNRISVHEVQQILDSLQSDSIGKIQFKVNYHFRNKNFVKSSDKSISYILKRDEEYPDSLFQFYFYEWESVDAENDTISSGETQ